jgi:hypothetical protein
MVLAADQTILDAAVARLVALQTIGDDQRPFILFFPGVFCAVQFHTHVCSFVMRCVPVIFIYQQMH